MTCLTKIDLENAQRDISDLASIINGPQSGTSSTITTRLGTVIKTLARVLYETTVPTASTIASLLDTYLGNTSWKLGGRTVLTANRTYYVHNSGSDSNDGLSAGLPFLTIQKALDECAKLDLSIYNVTISCSPGTYAGGNLVKGPWVGTGTVTIVGDTTTPANVTVLNGGSCFRVYNGGRLNISGVKLVSNSVCLRVQSNAYIGISGKVEFGAATDFHIYHDTSSTVEILADYIISGGALIHWFSVTAKLSCTSRTITITGTPAFAWYFVWSSRGATIECHNNTFSGAATGVRYLVDGGSLLYTNGAGASYLPGNVAGSVSGGATSGGGFVI